MEITKKNFDVLKKKIQKKRKNLKNQKKDNVGFYIEIPLSRAWNLSQK